MALIVKENIPNKKCWACGHEINNQGALMLPKAGEGIAYLHPVCAQSMSREILNDLCMLTALGYEIEDG